MGGLLHLLDQRLGQEIYLGCHVPCAANLSIFPFIRQFRAVGAGWFDAQTCRATQKWLQDRLQS
jgi:glutathione S-transferase